MPLNKEIKPKPNQIGYQIKEEKILRSFLFLVFLRIFFLENYEILQQIRQV